MPLFDFLNPLFISNNFKVSKIQEKCFAHLASEITMVKVDGCKLLRYYAQFYFLGNILDL